MSLYFKFVSAHFCIECPCDHFDDDYGEIPTYWDKFHYVTGSLPDWLVTRFEFCLGLNQNGSGEL